MYLIAPMEEEPPAAYISFVTTHLGELRRETSRLVGGDAEGAHLYMDVLADLAGHWRRLGLRARLGRSDARELYLHRRMTTRARHWRDDQIYEVDTRVLPAPVFTPAGPAASLALRKAAVLPGTARGGLVALADAEIAWVQAYRRQYWHRVGRTAAAIVIVLGTFIQIMSWISTPS
ncbi:hypothetical protein [Actinoplanes sp. NPDC051411]|uniref:hypothetical protein n=1 Tax=Actinoplanes sp. NPDC051411 TaxID=3155522 RepID=UPI00341BFA5D